MCIIAQSISVKAFCILISIVVKDNQIILRLKYRLIVWLCQQKKQITLSALVICLMIVQLQGFT